MKRAVLLSIIKEIEKEENLEKNGFFSTEYINDSYESFIIANRNGLVSFILMLLKSLKDFDFHLSKQNHDSTIRLKKGDWFDKESHFKFDWIKPIKENREAIIEERYIFNQKNKFRYKIFIFKMKFNFYALRILALIGGFFCIKLLYQLIF